MKAAVVTPSAGIAPTIEPISDERIRLIGYFNDSRQPLITLAILPALSTSETAESPLLISESISAMANNPIMTTMEETPSIK
ncbi:hypothetical protein DSECCO2_601010 [anaerobic digester metagenome]